MTERRIKTALISTDPKTREVVCDVLGTPGLGTTLDLEIPARFAEFGEEQVQSLRKLAPGLIVIDVEDDPDLGVRLAQRGLLTHAFHRDDQLDFRGGRAEILLDGEVLQLEHGAAGKAGQWAGGCGDGWA